MQQFSNYIYLQDAIKSGLIKLSFKLYFNFVKDFSAKMLFGANEVEIGKQWSNNKLLTSLSEEREFFGCLRRNEFVTVLFKQKSNKIPGDFLGRLVLGVEDEQVKIFGATIF